LIKNIIIILLQEVVPEALRTFMKRKSTTRSVEEDEFRRDFLCLERLDECWKCLRHTLHCNGLSDDGGACGTEEKRSGHLAFSIIYRSVYTKQCVQ
jgi:hypothetical protein